MADLSIVDAEVQPDPNVPTEQGTSGELIRPGQPVHQDTDDTWYLSYANGTSAAAEVHGLSTSRADVGRQLRIQRVGYPRLGASAGLEVGTSYGLSDIPGKIRPLRDVKVTDYRTGIGIGAPNFCLAMSLHNSGVLPGPALNESLLKWVLASQVANNTPQVGAIINRLGYDDVTFFFNIGAMADPDATFTVLMEGSTDAGMAGAVAIADGDMISQTVGVAPETAASWNFGHAGQVRKLGYLDNLIPYPYLRITVTPALNTGNADFFCYAVLGAPFSLPVTQTTA